MTPSERVTRLLNSWKNNIALDDAIEAEIKEAIEQENTRCINLLEERAERCQVHEAKQAYLTAIEVIRQRGTK